MNDPAAVIVESGRVDSTIEGCVRDQMFRLYKEFWSFEVLHFVRFG
jgi:hypothetical protein